MPVRVTYIWHDCFVVELPVATLVFDYWSDADGVPREFPSFLDEIPKDIPLYVFVSHFHKDHYNPYVFSWGQSGFSVHYFVSTDVWKRMRHIVSPTSVYSGPKVDVAQVSVMKPGEVWGGEKLDVKSFPSTDVGNSWLVTSGRCRMFHAGDLNAWIWRDKSDEREVAAGLKAFMSCLIPIRSALETSGGHSMEPIDICFFPVDSRIGSGYYEGAKIFLRSFHVRHFFPMHFALGDKDERAVRRRDALRTDLYVNPDRGGCIPLVKPSQYIEFRDVDFDNDTKRHVNFQPD